jgi:hypothetical protein
MAFHLKSITLPSFPKWPIMDKIRSYSWASLPRRILRKILAMILSILFLAVSLLFLAYSTIQITANTLGVNAQIADVSGLPNTAVGKCRLVYEGAGMYKVAVGKNRIEYSGVYCLYPAWPNHMEPNTGDWVKVWPAEKPFIAAPEMRGKGWILSVLVLIIGLAMFEFFLLAWTIH